MARAMAWAARELTSGRQYVKRLPVQLPTKFSLVVNLKTAKGLGLAVPESFLLFADDIFVCIAHVRFRGQSGYRSDTPQCLLMTQSGHWHLMKAPQCHTI